MKLKNETIKSIGTFLKNNTGKALIGTASLLSLLVAGRGYYDLANLDSGSSSKSRPNLYIYNPKYNEVIDAIATSSMLGSSKSELISIIKRGETDGYYEAIKSIMKSDMFDSVKVRTIKKL